MHEYRQNFRTVPIDLGQRQELQEEATSESIHPPQSDNLHYRYRHSKLDIKVQNLDSREFQPSSNFGIPFPTTKTFAVRDFDASRASHVFPVVEFPKAFEFFAVDFSQTSLGFSGLVLVFHAFSG
jgi:hypothetical protein